MGKREAVKVVVINRPTEEESVQRTKELCAFLEETWQFDTKGNTEGRTES